MLGKKGKHIEIGKLERFVADLVLDNHVLDDVPSKKCNGTVAIVGSGPAGLAAAQDLARMDYGVTIFESSTQPGGTLTYGIPTFRLHKEYVLREVERLEQLGVTIRYETKWAEIFPSMNWLSILTPYFGCRRHYGRLETGSRK